MQNRDGFFGSVRVDERLQERIVRGQIEEHTLVERFFIRLRSALPHILPLHEGF